MLPIRSCKGPRAPGSLGRRYDVKTRKFLPPARSVSSICSPYPNTTGSLGSCTTYHELVLRLTLTFSTIRAAPVLLDSKISRQYASVFDCDPEGWSVVRVQLTVDAAGGDR